jgi:hypothetical protein
MTACNSDKCPCPDCPAAKRVAASKAARAAHKHPDQHVAVPGATAIRFFPSGKRIYSGYRGADMLWSWRVWRVYPDGVTWFRKHDERRQKFFGAPWRYTPSPYSPASEDTWVRGAFHNAEIKPHVAVAGSMMSADRDPYARFASGGWVPPRRFGKSEFLRWDMHRRNEAIKQESVMTPLMLEVLLHAYYAAERFPRFNAPAYHEAVRRLTRDGLIEATSGREQANNPGWMIRTTEKGNVYVKALLNVPLPVQSEPEWRMPA